MEQSHGKYAHQTTIFRITCNDEPTIHWVKISAIALPNKKCIKYMLPFARCFQQL